MSFSAIVIQFLNGLAGASSLFLVAAGGGTILFLSYEWKRELLPSWLVVVHAVVAVVDFGLLLVAAYA